MGSSAFSAVSPDTTTGGSRWWTGLDGILNCRPELVGNAQSPYELGAVETSDRYDDMVLVTGRFRSGSTLLWNLFRHCDGVTAYYEPFNRRRLV